MITAGVDCGAGTVKAVVLTDGRVSGKSLVPSGIDNAGAAERAYAQALLQAGVDPESVVKVVATGAGKKEARFASDTISEVSADARGGVFLIEDARTVIDVGAEESRAIRMDAAGRVLDFAVNERCAACAGAFTEVMARALEVPLEELGPLSLVSTRAVVLNAQCAVFAESELIGLIHSKTPKPDMARAIHDAIAERIVSLVRRVGVAPEVLLAGGVAKNAGLVASLNRGLGLCVKLAPEPEFIGAIGAALVASGR